MHSKLISVLLLFLGAAGLAPAETAAEPATPPPATDPAYRLNNGDRILVNVFGEGDLSAQQMLDPEGNVRLPLLGVLALAGRTVREAEQLIEASYRDQEILRQPQVTLTVGTYAPREVTLLGAVRAPGTFQFPPDVTSMDIRDVVARQGGFTPVAKGDAVAVTRRQPDGREVTTVVNVARMMSTRARTSDERFFVQPGDRLFVPERLF
jgi:polysaccharide export outer membrane protein